MNANHFFNTMREAINSAFFLILDTGKSLIIKNGTTTKFSVDSSGNVEAAGGITAVDTNFTGDLDVGGSATVTGPLAAAGVTSNSPSSAFGYTTGAGGAVTQITNSATGVTLNTKCGQITTVALTTAAAAEERFTVTNSRVGAADCIVLSTTYDGAGTPMLSVQKVAAGSFDIVITNVHAANALNALMVINFAVIDVVVA